MESWAALILVVVLALVVGCVSYFVLKIYFPKTYRTIFPPPSDPESQTDEPNAPNGGRPSDSFDSDFDLITGMTRTMSVDSVASDVSANDLGPDLSPLGQLEVGLEYDSDLKELVVSVVQGKDLKQSPESNTLLSYYVKVQIAPSEANETRQTKVQQLDRSPVFKERFIYDMEYYEVPTKNVTFSVLSVDAYSKHRTVGHAVIDMVELDLVRPLLLWLNLRDASMPMQTYGEILFSLSYLPTAERLTVVIVKGKGLKWRDPQREPGEVMVKVHLYENGRKIAKRKTAGKRAEPQPSFNEAMIFSVTHAMLNIIHLRISVMEIKGSRKLQSIGHVVVGRNAGGKELTHWQHMLMTPRKPVAMWHLLRRHGQGRSLQETPTQNIDDNETDDLLET